MANYVNDMPIGALVVHSGLAKVSVLEAAHAHAQRHGRPLVESLVGSDHVPEGELARIMAEQLKLPRVNLGDCQPEPQATALISADQCRRHLVFPIELDRKNGFQFVVLAMADPLNSESLRAIHRITHLRIRPLIAQASDVCSAIARTYRCAFEPLMGMSEADLSKSPEVPQQVLQEPASIQFDEIENLLGPYLNGIDGSISSRADARQVLNQCSKHSVSARDKLVFGALLQLVDSEVLNPLSLFSSITGDDS